MSQDGCKTLLQHAKNFRLSCVRGLSAWDSDFSPLLFTNQIESFSSPVPAVCAAATLVSRRFVMITCISREDVGPARCALDIAMTYSVFYAVCPSLQSSFDSLFFVWEPPPNSRPPLNARRKSSRPPGLFSHPLMF